MASVSLFPQLLCLPLLLSLVPRPSLLLLSFALSLSFLISFPLSCLSHSSLPQLPLFISPLSPDFLNHFDICQILVALLSQAVSFFWSNVLKNNFLQLPSFQWVLVPRTSRMFTLLRKLIVSFRHKPFQLASQLL